MRYKSYLTVIIMLALILSVSPFAVAKGKQNIPTDHSQIVFVSGLSNVFDIYTMDLDDGKTTRLTELGDVYEPSWSPDGSQIAFIHYGYGEFEFYVMDADGSNQTRLTFNTVYYENQEAHPVWSPDGTQIAFAGEQDENWDVFLMDADGSNLVNLTNHHATDGELGLAWSPNGDQIVFTSNRDTMGRLSPRYYTNLYLLDVETREVSRLTTNTDENNTEHNYTDADPSWSPDGRQIAFISSRTGAAWWEIFVIDVEDLTIEQITYQSTNELTYTYEGLSWSPDGRQLVFASCAEHNRQNCELNIMQADGSDIIQLTDNDVVDMHPAWRPD